MVVISRCHTDVQRRKQREYVRLNPRNQQFNQIDKQHNHRRCNTHQIALEYERQCNQTQNYNVPGGDGHEQTNHQ